MSRNLNKKTSRAKDERSVRERTRDTRELERLDTEIHFRTIQLRHSVLRSYCQERWSDGRLKKRIAKLVERRTVVIKRWPETSGMRRRIAS